MKKAEKENLKTINGLDMLIYQAKKGFQHWFKKTPAYTSELRKLIHVLAPHRDTGLGQGLEFLHLYRGLVGKR